MPNDLPPEVPPSPERSILDPLTRVGRFQVEAIIGTGGMGEVYRAWDPALERSVALKALRPGEVREASAVERFRREALALAQLSHPNVCQVHELVDEPGGSYIAMELVEGQTLDQAADSLSLLQKLQVLRFAALGLAAAHSKGIVHRDLKPRNVMVTEDQESHELRVKVLDFGLARLMDPLMQAERPRPTFSGTSPAAHQVLEEAERKRTADSEVTAVHQAEWGAREESGPQGWGRITRAGTFMGSPSYASPEQIQGQAVGPASDVFSLGILAWELLANEHPYPGEGRNRMRAIAAGERRELKARGLPSGTADLLNAMLETHPFKRPSATKVAELLGQLARPRRVLRWTALAVAGSLLVAVGVNLYPGRGIIPDLTRQRPARLAVLPFVNGTGDPHLDSTARLILPEMLESALREHPKLAPLDPESVARARKAMRLAGDGPLHAEDRVRLAGALGTQLLLTGTLTKGSGNSFVLAYELSDSNGKIRHAGEAREAGERTVVVLPLARSLAGALLKAVAPFSSSHARTLPEIPAVALDAYARATDLMDRGEFREAAPAFQAAVQAAPDYAPAVLGYARCLSRLADAPAEPVYQWARWSARAQGNRIYEMKALHYLAIRLGERGQWEASDRTAQEALRLAHELGEAAFEAGVHATLGTTLQRRHKVPEAEAEYRQALALFESIGDKHSATRAMNNLAVVDRERGNLTSAESRYLEALQIVQSYGDKWGESFLLNNLGDLALAQEGSLDRAEAFFRKAEVLRKANGDESGLTYTLMGLASVAQARGELARAEDLDRQFLVQAQKTRLRPLEALALYNLGEVHRAGARYEEARAHYRQSLAIHEELKDAGMEAHCLAGEAECLAREGRHGLARALLERIPALTTEETPYLLRTQAWLARGERRAPEAQALFLKALSTARVQAPEIVAELKAALREGAASVAPAPRPSTARR